jgi:hypothetical protein
MLRIKEQETCLTLHEHDDDDDDDEICKDKQSGEHKTAGNTKLVDTHTTQQD